MARCLIALLVLAGCGDTTRPTTGTEPVVSDTPPPTTTPHTTIPPTTTVVPPATTPPPNKRATTTTTPPPSAVAPPDGVACYGWADLIAAYFPPEQTNTACSVLACETAGTGDPTIKNPSSTASGLFQFLSGTWTSTTGLPPPAAAYPPDVQIAAAAQLWRSSGWSPWACAP